MQSLRPKRIENLQLKIIFYGYEDEGNDPLEIAVIDSDTIVYDGWRCSDAKTGPEKSLF